MKYYPISVDPWDSDARKYMRIRSTKYLAGGYDPIALASEENFPNDLAGTPTRLIYDLPFIIDATDIDDTRPCTIYDTTADAELDRVTTSPASGEYRIVINDTSQAKCFIEFNTDAFDHIIDYDFYAIGMVLNSKYANIIHEASINLKLFKPIIGMVPSNNGASRAAWSAPTRAGSPTA